MTFGNNVAIALKMPPSNPSNSKWWAMLGVGLGILMFALDASIVNIALPTLVKVFQTSLASIELVVVSYLLVVSAFVLGAARLGDMVGKKRLYLIGLVVFTISSLLCGLATTETALIGFRVLQGFGAVFLSALGAAIVTEVFPDSQRGQALGIIGAVVSVGIAIGPSIGGLLLASFGWQSIFLVNIPIGIFAGYIVYRFVPNSAYTQPNQRFDWIGTLLAIALLSCFALGMTQGQEKGFSSSMSWGLLLAAGLGLVLFVVLESRIRQPMLDLSIFRNIELSASLFAAVLVFIVIAGIIFLLPFFLTSVLQYSVRQAGLLLGVSPVIGGLIAPLSGRLSDRIGARSISLVGLGFLLGGCLSISTFDAQLTNWGYVFRVIPFGVGIGMFQSPNNSIVLGGVPKHRLGIASGLLSLSRTLGQTAGIPIIGTVFTFFVAAPAQTAPLSDLSSLPPQSIVSGLQGGCYVAAALMVVAIITTGLASWRGKRHSASS